MDSLFDRPPRSGFVRVGVILIIIIILALAAFCVWKYRNSVLLAQFLGTDNHQGQLVSTATYSCDGGKTISAAYYAGVTKAPQPQTPDELPTPTGSVSLTLSDGRKMILPQTVSGSGARYANAGESFIFWNKGETAFVEEGADQTQTYTNCTTGTGTQDGTQGWSSYASSTLGFSVRYPQKYAVAQYLYTNLGPTVPAIPGVKFTIPPTESAGTNLGGDTYVGVEQIATSTCSADLFLDNPQNMRTITDNGVTYSVASTSGAGAGNFYEETVYAIPNSRPCVGVRYFVHSTNIGNYTPGTVTPFDHAALIIEFDKIRQSLVLGM